MLMTQNIEASPITTEKVFGYGEQSTSHIKNLWSQIEGKLKEWFHIIPNKKIIHFIKDCVFKIKINNKKTNIQKINEFFECVKFISNIEDVVFPDNYFYKDDISNYSSESDDD